MQGNPLTLQGGPSVTNSEPTAPFNPYPNPTIANNIVPHPTGQRPRRRGIEATAEVQQVAHRSENYSKAEDLLLISAFLNVTNDAATGTNQSAEAYWQRILSYYNANNRSNNIRGMASLKGRWKQIAKDTNRFCGIKAEQDRLNQSGKTEDDRINDALSQYKAMVGKPYKMLHCWHALKDHPKWLGLLNDKAVKGAAQVPAEDLNTPGLLQTPPSLTRPMGHDSAKKRKKDGSSDASSAAVEVLNQMMGMRDSMDKDEDDYRNAKMAVLREQTEIKKRQLDIFERQDERAIMAMDTSNLDEEGKKYFQNLKASINRRIAQAAQSSNPAS